MSVVPTVVSGVVPGARLGARSLVVAGREMPLFAGAMHYAGASPRHTVACLRAMRTLGFTVVDTTVPWSAHEKGPGQLDFAGALDLGAFLDASFSTRPPRALRNLIAEPRAA